MMADQQCCPYKEKKPPDSNILERPQQGELRSTSGALAEAQGWFWP